MPHTPSCVLHIWIRSTASHVHQCIRVPPCNVHLWMRSTPCRVHLCLPLIFVVVVAVWTYIIPSQCFKLPSNLISLCSLLLFQSFFWAANPLIDPRAWNTKRGNVWTQGNFESDGSFRFSIWLKSKVWIRFKKRLTGSSWISGEKGSTS